MYLSNTAPVNDQPPHKLLTPFVAILVLPLLKLSNGLQIRGQC